MIKYDMQKQVCQEHSFIHPHIFKKVIESSKKDVIIKNIRDVHDGHISFRDFEVDIISNGNDRTVVIEGKRDTFKKEETIEEEHLVSEIFGHVNDEVFNFDSLYHSVLKSRVGVDLACYDYLWDHINNLYKDRKKYGKKVKLGYGFSEDLNINVKEFPVFSYYWHKWKKAALFDGKKINNFTKKCFENKHKDCKIVLTPNRSWTTVNLLIPFKLLRDNGCLIKMIDFNEETVIND